jgi:hypothetical protein
MCIIENQTDLTFDVPVQCETYYACTVLHIIIITRIPLVLYYSSLPSPPKGSMIRFSSPTNNAKMHKAANALVNSIQISIMIKCTLVQISIR